MSYPKDIILWYFNNQEVGIPPYLTSMFHDSLLCYVDEFCRLVNTGIWIPKKYGMGTQNWYFEFKDYLMSINVKIIWKNAPVTNLG